MKVLKCFRGIYDKTNVICLQGDLVSVTNVDEGEIIVEGIEGWSIGHDMSFTPKQIVSHFIYHSEK